MRKKSEVKAPSDHSNNSRSEDLGPSSPPSSARKKKNPKSSDAAGQSCPTQEAVQTNHCSPIIDTMIDEEAGPFSQSYARARETSDVKSSIKKLTDLDVISENELRSALSRVPIKHVKEHTKLFDSYKLQYSKWHFQLRSIRLMGMGWDRMFQYMSRACSQQAARHIKYVHHNYFDVIRCNFGLLMYGFGSKKALLEDFASSTLVDGAAVVVNGYLPSVNIKSVIYTVAEALWNDRNAKKASSKLDRPASEHSIDELISYLNDNKEDNFHVYVIVHNIDGPSLRDDDTQRVLANLAACKHVRFVASVDHVNSPLLWNKCMSSTKFNWCWHNTPTYSPYTVESMHMPLILISIGSAKSAKGALLVLQSLTPNAQSVFRTLANYQLNHPEEQGLSVHKLYTLCRERFLVSSEVTLRSHLTEFKDHELVRSRRGLDGQDCLFIPLPVEPLTKLLEQIGT